MGFSDVELVETFHLAFLRVLEKAYDRRKYVVKGGVNVRAWFGSVRYSEDMDIDAIGGEQHKLEDAVNGLVTGRCLEHLLAQHKLEIAESSTPKMTETTQRWKFGLRIAGAATLLRTKVEFSWRSNEGEPYVLEPVRRALARSYGITPPSANHYTAPAAIRQKLRALVQRREVQARDIWDLNQLFRQPESDPRPLNSKLIERLDEAERRIDEAEYGVFLGQVGAYLAPEDQELHGDEESWDRIRLAVMDRLMELRDESD